MKNKRPIADFFDTKGKIIVIFAMMFFGVYLLQDFTTLEPDTRKYEIRCVDDNGIYFQFYKTKDEWWISAFGTLVVIDRGERHSFDRRQCIYKPI